MRHDGHQAQERQAARVSRGGAPGSSVSPMARASTAIEPAHRLTRNNGADWPTP